MKGAATVCAAWAALLAADAPALAKPAAGTLHLPPGAVLQRLSGWCLSGGNEITRSDAVSISCRMATEHKRTPRRTVTFHVGDLGGETIVQALSSPADASDQALLDGILREFILSDLAH